MQLINTAPSEDQHSDDAPNENIAKLNITNETVNQKMKDVDKPNFTIANLSYDYDEYMDEQHLLANDPTVRTVAAITLFIYFIAAVVGIPANIYVLFRMKKLAKNDHEKYRSGTGIALCTMAAADLCSLLLILSQNLMQLYPQIDSDTILMHFVCKMVLFLTHTVTGISVWSWLLLSTLRYLAIRHPLFHLRIWQMPCRALSFIVIISFALNAWLLLAVHSTQFGCIQHALFQSLTWNRLFHIIESAWSFCVPCLLISIMDISVLIKSTIGSCDVCLKRMIPSLQQHTEQTFEPLTVVNNSRNSQAVVRHKHSRTLWRWLAIAFICIILNTPENMYRMVILFRMPDVHEEALHFSARMLAQALYFSQFAFNAVFLALFVYDKSTKPKTYLEHSVGGNSVSVCQTFTIVATVQAVLNMILHCIERYLLRKQMVYQPFNKRRRLKRSALCFCIGFGKYFLLLIVLFAYDDDL